MRESSFAERSGSRLGLTQTNALDVMKNPNPLGIILYVEDEENDVFFMNLAFGKAGLGHLFRTVPNGRDAMQYLSGADDYADRQRFPLPAAMLLDLSLPMVSGFEVLEWVRRQARFHRLPVVMFSGSVRTEDREKALKLGATDYIEKPTSPLKFTNLVEWLSKDLLVDSELETRPS